MCSGAVPPCTHLPVALLPAAGLAPTRLPPALHALPAGSKL